MNTIESLAAIVSIVGAGVSWHFARASKLNADKALGIAEKEVKLSEQTLLEGYISEAANRWQDVGPVGYVDSLPVDEATKEMIWEQSFRRNENRVPRVTFRQQKADVESRSR